MKNVSILVDILLLGACAWAVTACGPGGSSPSAAVPAPPAISATSSADAFLVLPGDYAQSTTMADLEARFGKANVRRETTPDPHVVLFPDDPTRRATVTFHEPGAFKELQSITVTDPGSRWRGKQGVHVGMSFAKLRELNGKPFFFSGFDDRRRALAHDAWSPSMSDEDSTLGALDVTEGDHLYFEVELRLRDPALAPKASDLPVDEHLSSDDPRFPQLGEWVVVTGFGARSSLDDEWE